MRIKINTTTFGIIIIILAIVLFFYTIDITKIQDYRNENRKTFIRNGHYFIKFGLYEEGAIIHDPDCHICKK